MLGVFHLPVQMDFLLSLFFSVPWPHLSFLNLRLSVGVSNGGQCGTLKGGGANDWGSYSIYFFPSRLRIGSSWVLLVRPQLLVGKPHPRGLVDALSPCCHGHGMVMASCFCGCSEPSSSLMCFLNPFQTFVNCLFIKLYSVITLNE